MTQSQPRSHLGTHEVFNQPVPLMRNPFAEDAALRGALGADLAKDADLVALGAADRKSVV